MTYLLNERNISGVLIDFYKEKNFMAHNKQKTNNNEKVWFSVFIVLYFTTFNARATSQKGFQFIVWISEEKKMSL